MLGIDPKAARTTWTAALTLLLLAVVYAVRSTLVIFAIALLFAYLLHPLADQIGRRFSSKNRAPALALTYLLVIGLMAALFIAIGSRVANEARYLFGHPPDVGGLADRLRSSHPAIAPLIDSLRGRAVEQIGTFASAAPRLSLTVLAASANLIYLVLIPILSFFFLKDGGQLRDALLSAFNPGASRALAKRTLARIHIVLLQYMRALLILCSTALAIVGITLSVMGVRYALLLASIAFFCEFVPLVGPIAEIVTILAVSALTGYTHLWWLLIFLLIFRLIQDYAIWPRLMSEGVELHPLWVIFGVLAGGELGGVAGIFLSVPVIALARVILVRDQVSTSS